ncbi:MAG: type II toxin-antitoxin system PemK/MazF family toxin [Candidatus Paceibacterota bacterium]|jgi:mRNA interferase MazF
MSKRHDEWNRLQQALSNKTTEVFCNKREIWWCSIGMNIGTELYGKNELFERPVLILKVYNKETALVIPLTSKLKEGKYYSPVKIGNSISNAVLSQVRTISTKRLSRKVGKISSQNYNEVLQKYLGSV